MRRVLAARALIAVALAGCGGGDDGSTASSATTTHDNIVPTTSSTSTTQEPQPPVHAGSGRRSVIGAVFVLGPPKYACGKLMTSSFIREAYGDVRGCEAALSSGGFANSIETVSEDRSGDRAIFKIVPTGGPSDGETLTVTLVHDQGTWKVDTLRSNVPVGP